jgi:hypothetical protein
MTMTRDEIVDVAHGTCPRCRATQMLMTYSGCVTTLTDGPEAALALRMNDGPELDDGRPVRYLMCVCGVCNFHAVLADLPTHALHSEKTSV